MSILKKSAIFVTAVVLSFMILAGAAYGATYTVQSGDSLYRIGILFNTSADIIRSDNKLPGDLIYPGQKLYVRAHTHTVKSGDTLSKIAGWYGVSLAQLRKANNKWDDMIYPGQVLNIPAAGTGPSASKAVVSYTQSELDLLARLVRAEAESEPYAAKVGVAAVVLNRVKSNGFPNTISSVIYEVSSNGYYQFTPVENGMINRPATQQDINAAIDALNGSDPSNGALFYFDDSATNKWLWSKPIKAWIGRMVFVY
jgi:spore germination cell wall hydrolase CwlJ-like protein